MGKTVITLGDIVITQKINLTVIIFFFLNDVDIDRY